MLQETLKLFQHQCDSLYFNCVDFNINLKQSLTLIYFEIKPIYIRAYVSLFASNQPHFQY